MTFRDGELFDLQECDACGRVLFRFSPDGLGPVCRRKAAVARLAITLAHADGIGYWDALAKIRPSGLPPPAEGFGPLFA